MIFLQYLTYENGQNNLSRATTYYVLYPKAHQESLFNKMYINTIIVDLSHLLQTQYFHDLNMKSIEVCTCMGVSQELKTIIRKMLFLEERAYEIF